jgi:hypothetical protein
MNAIRFVLLPCCWALLAGPAPAAGPPAGKTEVRVFRLKEIAVAKALRIVRDLLGDDAGPRGRIRVSADADASRLIVLATAEGAARVAAILKAIDTGNPDRSTLVIHLRGHGELPADVEKTFRAVAGERARVYVDRSIRSLIITADKATLARVSLGATAFAPWEIHTPLGD